MPHYFCRYCRLTLQTDDPLASLQCPRCPHQLSLGLSPPTPLAMATLPPPVQLTTTTTTTPSNTGMGSGNSDGGDSDSEGSMDEEAPQPHPMRLRSQSGVNRSTGGGDVVAQLKLKPGNRLAGNELHRVFDEFNQNFIHHVVWGARAIERFQLFRTRLFVEIHMLLRALDIAGLPLGKLMKRCDAMLKREMTAIEWIASFACLRRVFTQRLATTAAAREMLVGNSVHLDTTLPTQVGTVQVRNSQNKNKAGTTRMFIIVYARGDAKRTTPLIFDPSYSEVRKLLESLDASNPQMSVLLARIMLRWTARRNAALDELTERVCDKVLYCSANVFTDIAQPIPDLDILRYCRNRTGKSESKHLLSGFAEAGKCDIAVRLGDLLSLFWAILFLAEARHAPLVSQSNLELLELVADGRIGLSDCMATISRQENKQKLFPAYTGGLFPSQNFAEHNNPNPHKKRYVILNELSGLDDKLVEQAEGLDTLDKIDAGIDLREDIRRRLRTWFGDHRDAIDPAELFVLYKIAFIEFLRGEVFNGMAPLPGANEPRRRALDDFNERLRGFLQLQMMSHKLRPGPQSADVSQGSVSQFAVPGGSVGCSPMAALAIAHLFNTNGEVSSAAIDNILLEGTVLYQGMADDAGEQQELMQAMALSLTGEPQSAALLGNQPHFNPTEIPEEELIRRGVKRSKTETCKLATVCQRVQAILSSRPRIAITLVAGGYTISVTRIGNFIYVFDSHGWRSTNNAFIRSFPVSAFGNLCKMLEVMLGDRVGGSLVLFREALRKQLGKSPFSKGLSLMAPKKSPPSQAQAPGKGKDDMLVEEGDEDEDDISLTIFKPLDGN